jgi:prephenate dehydrogenase
MATFRLSILGVGLLGGSIGLAASRRISDCHVTGYGHRPDTLRRSLELQAIHVGTIDIAEAVREADLVVLATPVGLFEGLLKEMAPHLKHGVVVTDVGSTKRSVVKSAEAILPPHAKFVGSHPMAGSEKRGVEFATADLFENALCILTPTQHSDENAVETVRWFWRTLGMRLIDLSPDDHDRAVSQISHLPHAVAAAMVTMQQDLSLNLAGKGFTDSTRIAAGDGTLWRDILLDNRDNVQAAIDSLIAQLHCLSGMLKSGDSEGVKQWLDDAAERRAGMTGKKNTGS